MNWKRFFFGRLSLQVLLFTLPFHNVNAQVGKPYPNIIFVLVDDQGYGDLGVFYQNQRSKLHDPGKPFEVSPHIDQLASEGALLTQHYCAAPVCAPSRASLLLGVSQGHANVRDNQFDKALEDNYTMASSLRELGYSTAVIGKWGLEGNDKYDINGYQWPAHPLKRGFEYFFGYMRHSDGHEHYPKEGLYKLYWAEKQKKVWENFVDVTINLDKCYTTDLWTAVAKKYITDHAKGGDNTKPFLLYLAFDAPHAVLELPTGKYPSGGGIHGGIQWLGTPGHFINTAEGKPDSFIYPEYKKASYDDDHNPATPQVPWPETYQRYATANRRIDDAVGDISQLLKDLKIDSNTLIVYTSDNGPSIESYLPNDKYVPNHPNFFSSYGPFDGIKRDSWEGGIRMPTIAWWPGHIPAGKVISTPSISYDWAPTFIDMAGQPAPERMDGASLLPSLTGVGKVSNRPIYIEYYAEGSTPDFKEFSLSHRGRIRGQMQLLRMGDYVGVRYNIKSAEDSFEIYNVRMDPKEENNLALEGREKIFVNGFKANDANVMGQTDINTLETYMKAGVLQVRHSNISAPRPYDSALVPSVEKGHLIPGVEWKLYNGNFHWIPQLTTLKAAAEGHSLNLDIKGDGLKNALTFFTGYIRVPTDGEYSFYLACDAKAFLRIHDAQVIDADYGYPGSLARMGSLFLKAGLHPFRLYYYRYIEDGPPFLKLDWSGPGMARQHIQNGVFFRDNIN